MVEIENKLRRTIHMFDKFSGMLEDLANDFKMVKLNEPSISFSQYWSSLSALEKDQLCERSGLSKPHISRLASKGNPNWATLQKLRQGDSNISYEMFESEEYSQDGGDL